MDSCTEAVLMNFEVPMEFRWISLTGIFVSFDWLKMNSMPSAFLHLWIYSFV
jgi:hypothetical protein